MRILHLIASERWSGAAVAAAELAAAQKASGHDVEFACRAGRGLERKLIELGLARADGFDLHRSMLRDRRELLRRVKDFDVIHCHLPSDHLLAFAALGRKRNGKPLLVRTLHRGLTAKPGLLRAKILKASADLYIVPSNSDRDRLLAAGFAQNQVACVRGAVDIDRFRPGLDGAPLRREFNIDPAAPVFGTVSRMRRGRGQFDLLKAFASVARAVPTARWIVAGSGSEQALFRKQLAGRPDADRIIFIGHRKDDLPQAYAAMDVCVVPAPGSDGSCRAALEAMSCARPVVAMKRGALADIVVPNATGWLADSTESLSAALIEALNNPSRTRELGNSARRRVETAHKQSDRAQSTLAAYERATNP
ncbi:glycosyltransferase family 4 protein [bacterium]|nr:glycosyltransferase family 4 protein [bacterium]